MFCGNEIEGTVCLSLRLSVCLSVHSSACLMNSGLCSSGVWEEWLVMYQNECLQFYDLKDTAMTSPCAQVSFKSVDSVHDIDDQQVCLLLHVCHATI